MTNSPEASTPASEPTATDPSAAEGAEISALDEGTFSRILEPRSANRLPIGDGTWHQLARQYVWVQLISSGILFLLVLAAALAIWLIVGVGWVWIPAGIVLVILAITLAVTPRQARAYGYQLREDDLVFRKGILWQLVVAVPYGRMQLVDITHGPLDRSEEHTSELQSH